MGGYIELAGDDDEDVGPNEGGPTPGGSGEENENENEDDHAKGMPPPRDPPTRGAGPRPPSAEGMPKPEDSSSSGETRPGGAPIPDRPRRSRLHPNGILSSTHLGFLGRRYLLLRGLRLRLQPRSAEFLDCAGEGKKAFLISTLDVDGLRKFQPFLQHTRALFMYSPLSQVMEVVLTVDLYRSSHIFWEKGGVPGSSS